MTTDLAEPDPAGTAESPDGPDNTDLPPGTPWIGREASFGRALAVITGLGAMWRLAYLVFAKADEKLALTDAMYYSIQAGLNAKGDWFQDGLTGQPGAEHGFLTSFYLTPWSFGSGDHTFSQRLGLTLLGSATVAVIGLAARRLAQQVPAWRRMSEHDRGRAERIGLVAAAIAAIYPNLWINDSVIMSETIGILLVSLALLVAVGHHASPTVRNGALLGFLAGLGALTRSELVLLIPGFAGVSLLVCRLRHRPSWPALAVVVAAVVTILPWGLYNSSRFDEPAFLSTNDGSTLLGANCDNTYYGDDLGGWDLFCLGPLDDVGLGHDAGDPDASQRSAARRQRAAAYVSDNLDRLPVVAAARLGRTFDLYGLSSMVYLDTGEQKAEWAVWAGIVSWWVLALAAFGGWRVLARREVGARWWLAVPWVGVLVTTVAVYGAHRIRSPGEPTVVILAAIVVVQLWARYRSGSEPASPETNVTTTAAIETS